MKKILDHDTSNALLCVKNVAKLLGHLKTLTEEELSTLSAELSHASQVLEDKLLAENLSNSSSSENSSKSSS